MPTVGTSSKPAYVYDAGTDTWIPIGPGEHTHAYVEKSTLTTTGDIVYASAANTPARLGIGSTDQVLKVSGGLPAWGAAPNGYTLLASGNLPTNANTTTISGLSTSYQDLVIEIYGVTFGSAAGYGVNSSGSWGRYSGTILAADTSTGDAYAGTYPRFVDKTWTSQTANNMTIRVFNYAATYGKSFAYWGFMADGTNTWGTTAGGGINSASAINTITIFSIFGTSPNFTGGSYKIWGVK